MAAILYVNDQDDYATNTSWRAFLAVSSRIWLVNNRLTCTNFSLLSLDSGEARCTGSNRQYSLFSKPVRFLGLLRLNWTY